MTLCSVRDSNIKPPTEPLQMRYSKNKNQLPYLILLCLLLSVLLKMSNLSQGVILHTCGSPSLSSRMTQWGTSLFRNPSPAWHLLSHLLDSHLTPGFLWLPLLKERAFLDIIWSWSRSVYLQGQLSNRWKKASQEFNVSLATNITACAMCDWSQSKKIWQNKLERFLKIQLNQ